MALSSNRIGQPIFMFTPQHAKRRFFRDLGGDDGAADDGARVQACDSRDMCVGLVLWRKFLAVVRWLGQALCTTAD